MKQLEWFEKEGETHSGCFWTCVVVGFFFPLLWFVAGWIFFENVKLTNKQEQYKKELKIKYAPKPKPEKIGMVYLVLGTLIIGGFIFFIISQM